MPWYTELQLHSVVTLNSTVVWPFTTLLVKPSGMPGLPGLDLTLTQRGLPLHSVDEAGALQLNM
jgi:hypothetical protein